MAIKAFSLKSKSFSVDRKMSLFAMVSIALLAIFNFQNVIDNYIGMGLSATIAFLIAVVVFLFPFIFIIAEFASLVKGTKSGLTSWIKTSVGRKTAFLTSFMFWFANLTFFFSAVPSRINYLSFAVTGNDYTSDSLYNTIIPWAAVGFFLIITLISTLNTKKISKITSLGGSLMIGITVFFFVIAIIGWIAGAINPANLPQIDPSNSPQAPGIEGSKLDVWGETGGLGFGWISTFIWVLMAADGAQTLGVYVNDVKGGKKTFVRAMLISVSLIGFAYVIGTLLASVFPPIGGLAAGWASSFANLFYFILKPMGVSAAMVRQITFIIIGLIFFISSIGGLIVWTSAPVKVMFSEIEPGIFGQKLSKENRNGVCSFGSWVQFLIVVPLMLFLMLSKGDLSSSLSLIKGAAGWIGMLPWIVIFISYVNLRWKRDYEERGFRFGNRIVGITVGMFLTILIAIILVLTFFDTAPLDKPYNKWPSDWYLGVVLKIVMIVLILVPAYLWYYFKFEYQLRDVKIANKLGINHELVVYKHNFLSKLKYKYFFNKEYQDFENHKNKFLLKSKKEIDEKLHHINKLNEKINNTNDKQLIKEFKLEIKQQKTLIKQIKKQCSISIKELKLKLKNEINERANKNKEEFRKIYQEKFISYIDQLKIKQKENKKDSKLKQQIKKQRRVIKKELKNVLSAKSLNKEQKQQKTSELLLKLEQIRIEKPYSDLMLEELNSSVEKDINLDGVDLSLYFKDKNDEIIFDGSIVFDYGKISKKIYSDKIVISNNKLLLVKNNAYSLIGKEYNIHNMKCIPNAKDKSIKIINSGNWIELDKVDLIYIENSQIESFSIYIENSKEFVGMFK